MGSWDITMRQSDYELSLLKIVVKIQLKKVNFSAFNVTQAIDVLRQDYSRGYQAEYGDSIYRGPEKPDEIEQDPQYSAIDLRINR